MVICRSFVLVLFLLSSNLVISQESQNDINAENLEQMFNDGEKRRQSAADRLKASRANKSNLRILQDKEINYKLPNGEYVSGILLPNGKVAPAIRDKYQLIPACVTKEFQLVQGRWDNENNIIVCELESADLAFLEDSEVTQVGFGNQLPTANKYDKTTNQQNDLPDNKNEADTTLDEIVLEDGTIVKRDGTIIKKDGTVSDTSSLNSNTITANANKYNKNSNHSNPQYSSANSSSNSSNNSSNASYYVPPPRNSSSNNSAVGVLRVDDEKFGISMGTWVRAELIRNVTSAETGQIEFRILDDVPGRIKPLPAETILFANKQFNEAARRLEALTSVAILPNGEEISGINAYLYADDKTAGLTGAIIRDRKGEVVSAGTNTLLNTAARTLGGNLGVEAAADLSKELLQNERKNAPKQPSAYIQVVKQEVWLKVSKSF